MSPNTGHLRDTHAARFENARRLEDNGRFAEAASAWQTLAGAVWGSARAEALAEQARVVRAHLGDPEGAARLHRRALEHDPAYGPSLEALLEHGERTSNWLRVAALLRLRFGSAESPRERVALALEAGRLQIERLHNPHGARTWLNAGLSVDPHAIALHEALADLERLSQDDDALLARLERASELRGSGASPANLLEAAQLRSERGDAAEALAHLTHAARIAPDDTLVLDALSDALASNERHAELAHVLERRAAMSIDDPQGRAALLMELGDLCEHHLFDPEAALDAYRRAHAADPNRPGAEEALQRLGAKLAGETEAAREAPPAAGDPEARLRECVREASITTDRGRFGELAREIERLHTRIGAPEGALPWIARWARLAPDEPEALRAQARLYNRPGHETELCATLEALDRFLEPLEQAENRRRMGGVYLHRGLHDAAIRSFERALEVEPDSVEALEGLVWVRREGGQIPELITAQWRLAEQLEPPRRTACLEAVARLQEQTGDLAGAIATHLWIERDGGHASLAEQAHLDALLERSGRVEQLLSRLEARAAHLDSAEPEAIEIELRRARLLLRSGRDGEAATLYRGVLERAPGLREARGGLEAALRSGIDAAGLADFLALEMERAPDREARERSALERAVLLEEMLSRQDEACALYRELAREAGDPELRAEAAGRYEVLLESAGDWLQLRAQLEYRAGHSEPAERVRIHEQLAALCAARLRDEAGELSHLERLAELDPSRGDVWRRLALRYERSGRSADWRRAMEAELAAGPEPNRELTVHARLAESCLEEGDRAEATHHYVRVFELNPAHTTAAGFLVARFREEGRPEEVLRVLEARLATLSQDVEAEVQRTALRMQIAEVQDEELGDLEGAISTLEVALGETGAGSPVARPLAGCYARAGYDLDLIELCRPAAAASADAAERANWLVRLGDAHLERSETREAADAYSQALSQRPDDRALQASLRELHRQHGDRVALAQLLEAELAHLAGHEEIGVRLELASLLADPALGRAADALNHIRRVLQLEPNHGEGFERAVALAAQVRDYDSAIELIDARLASARNDAQRSALLARRAGILARQSDRVDRAIADLERSIELAVDPVPLRAELAVLLERTQRYSSLLALEEARLAERPEAERVEACERASELALREVSPAAALPWLTRLRHARPADASVLARIAEVHRGSGDQDALLHVLSEQGALESDPRRRRVLAVERAEILKSRGEHGRAARALMDACEADPIDAPIRVELAQLQQRLGWHAERTRTLESLIDLPGSDVLALRSELAKLCEGPLCDPERAVAHLRAALPLVPSGSPQAIGLLRDLARCQRALHRVEDWAATCELELAALDAAPVFDERRREIRRALAGGYDRELGRPDDALRHLRALLASDALGLDERAQLESDCLRLLRAAGDSVEFERRLTAHLDRHPDKGDLWLELASLRERQLHAPAAAQYAYQRALESLPHSRAALRGLRRTAEYLGHWHEVADALERELDHPDCTDGSERASLLRRLGHVCWHRLESTTRASRCYAAATESDPRDFAALRALQRLLEAMEDFPSAADLYESEIEILGDEDPARTREAWLRIASIADEQLNDMSRARSAFARAAEISPLRRQRLLRSAELHERAGDREAFAEEFAAWCDAEDTETRADDHLRLADCLAALSRTEEAVARTGKALDAEPGLARAWALAGRLQESTGDYTAAAASLRQEAALLPDADASAALLRAADLVEPHDPGAALVLIRDAVLRNPAEPAARVARARVAFALEHFEETAQAASEALALPGADALDEAAFVATACAGGEAARRLGQLDRAAGLFSRALERAPKSDLAEGPLGETLAALGDHENASRVLEARLARDGSYPERARHETLLAECLEARGDFEAAMRHFEAALGLEPKREEALEGAVRVWEALGNADEGIASLERWAAATPVAARVGERLLRAALWEREVGDREASAEQHLRAALRADPQQPVAWIALASQLFETGRYGEAAETADRAAAYATCDAELSTLALLQAHGFEVGGDRRRAADAFALASEADARSATAALAHARLLRGFGEWEQACASLTHFIEHYPDPESRVLAALHEQLGRLQAGPLERIDAAIASYRRAVHHDPERTAVRAALAELLSHRPEDWDEALFHHRIVLAADPTQASALRVALRVAEGRDNARAIADGHHILRALGVAAPHEQEAQSAGALSLANGAGALEDPLHEKLRLMIAATASEIAEALESPLGPAGGAGGNDEARFRDATLEAAGKLTSHAILTLETAELAELAGLLAAIATEAEEIRGDGRLVNALSSTLRRRHRRKLRRILEPTAVAEIEGIDFDAWRDELRALAAWTALRRGDTSLRVALVALARDAHDSLDDPMRDDADISELVASAPVARALLRRIVFDWLEDIE